MTDALKSKVKQHWEKETCGIRYSDTQNGPEMFKEIELARQKLIPYLGDFVQFEQANGKEVLEIGVGAGTDFCNWVENGAHATGVDLTEAAINITQNHLAARNLSAKELKTDDAENLSFANKQFDIVYSWGVLHHTPDTNAAFREVCRVLKPGGKFIGMIYHSPCVSDVLLWIVHGLAKGRIFVSPKRIVFEKLESHGTKVYSVTEAHSLLAKAGFENIEISTKLAQGDLLDLKLSSKYNHIGYEALKLVYPRWFVRNFIGDRFGRGLLIKATKPARY